jgi:hypothetical protein
MAAPVPGRLAFLTGMVTAGYNFVTTHYIVSGASALVGGGAIITHAPEQASAVTNTVDFVRDKALGYAETAVNWGVDHVGVPLAEKSVGVIIENGLKAVGKVALSAIGKTNEMVQMVAKDPTVVNKYVFQETAPKGTIGLPEYALLKLKEMDQEVLAGAAITATILVLTGFAVYATYRTRNQSRTVEETAEVSQAIAKPIVSTKKIENK